MAALLAIIVAAGIKLSRYGDIIAEKSGLSRDWMGLPMGGVLTQAWAIRSERESLPAQSALSNSMLLYAVLLTFCLQLALLYVPWLNPIFKTEPLGMDGLALCLALSSVVFVGVEIEKWLALILMGARLVVCQPEWGMMAMR